MIYNGIENGEEVYLTYFTPGITSSAYNNLYGRIMTLVEAVTEDSKIRSVKQLFKRELNDYFENLERNVKELDQDHIAGHGYYYKNVYVYDNQDFPGRIIESDSPKIDI